MRRLMTVLGLLGSLLAAAPALAQTFNSGSTGADGAFAPTASTTLTLPANGVFNFTTINIPAGVTVRFARNAANTPVTLLVTGNVTITGVIEISGATGDNASVSTRVTSNGGAGGPGGFDGGGGATGVVSTTGGSGLGPGGGGGGVSTSVLAGGGGFALQGGGTAGGPAYGNPSLLPLIGGSGGGGGSANFGNTGGGGGGGGGALIVASSGSITLNGTINAIGGFGGGGFVGGSALPGGGGSGGAVRLVASSITGGGAINIGAGIGGGGAGTGSPGRARLEAFSNTATFRFFGAATASISGAPPTSVTLANEPTLRIASVAGVAAPATPTASLTNPDITLPAATTNPVTVGLAAANIPPGTSVTVTVSGQMGGASSTSVPLAGTQTSSTASASVTIPTNQPSVISATASFTLVAANGGPVFAQGEQVERVRVTATSGGGTQLVYITKSGREIQVR